MMPAINGEKNNFTSKIVEQINTLPQLKNRKHMGHAEKMKQTLRILDIDDPKIAQKLTFLRY